SVLHAVWLFDSVLPPQQPARSVSGYVPPALGREPRARNLTAGYATAFTVAPHRRPSERRKIGPPTSSIQRSISLPAGCARGMQALPSPRPATSSIRKS